MSVHIVLTCPDPKVAEDPQVRDWIEVCNLIVQERMRAFLGDLAAYGVAYTFTTALPTQEGKGR